MIINKDICQIKISFYNLENDIEKRKKLPSEKFNIFIKNIGPDPRSKIECFDIKLRIYNFFKDLENIFLEQYHQMAMDEYLEIIRYNSQMERNFRKKLVKIKEK